MWFKIVFDILDDSKRTQIALLLQKHRFWEERFKEILDSSINEFVWLYSWNLLIGALTLSTNPSNWIWNWISVFIIDEQYRSKWLWSQMLSLIKSKFSSLYVDVSFNEPKAISFYKQNWFVEIWLISNWFEAENQDAYIMRYKK